MNKALLCLTPPTEWFSRDDLRKILPGCQRVANVPNGVETLRKTSIALVWRTNVTDNKTDGLAMTYSVREREFTFAENYCM